MRHPWPRTNNDAFVRRNIKFSSTIARIAPARPRLVEQERLKRCTKSMPSRCVIPSPQPTPDRGLVASSAAPGAFCAARADLTRGGTPTPRTRHPRGGSGAVHQSQANVVVSGPNLGGKAPFTRPPLQFPCSEGVNSNRVMRSTCPARCALRTNGLQPFLLPRCP